MSLGAGKRDRKVTFQRAAAAADGLGAEPATVWTTLCTEWASVRYGTSAERRAAAADGATQAATFGVPFNTITCTLTPQDRLLLDTQPWDIQAVATSPGNAGVVVSAVVAKG